MSDNVLSCDQLYVLTTESSVKNFATITVTTLISVVFLHAPAYADGCTVVKVATYPLAIHQLPLTTIHEGSHWLTHKAFGQKASIHLLPECRETEQLTKHGKFKRESSSGYVVPENSPSGAQEALASIAPYAMRLLAVDRAIEFAYRHHSIRDNSFADKYIQAAFLLDATGPFGNLFNKNSDLGRFSTRTHIPRVIVVATVQSLYFWSYVRVMKARSGSGIWTLYVHGSF